LSPVTETAAHVAPLARPIRRPTAATRVTVVREGREGPAARPDVLVTEEPMEIRACGPGEEPEAVAVTMRTPGHDFELAVGFLATEGLLGSYEELESVRYCDLPLEEQQFNVVTVHLRVPFDSGGRQRRTYTTSSCGLCGTATLDQVEVACQPLPAGPDVAPAVVRELPKRLRQNQQLFRQTGGLHAAGLFDPAGRLIVVREDVGRHNAVDKVVGFGFLDQRLPLHQCVLMVSGRVSFEVVQKAAVAGIPVVCAVSAPSSLAVSAADRLGMTVVGFVRGPSFNVYSHPERLGLPGAR
jgi:FdhD protein